MDCVAIIAHTDGRRRGNARRPELEFCVLVRLLLDLLVLGRLNGGLVSRCRVHAVILNVLLLLFTLCPDETAKELLLSVPKGRLHFTTLQFTVPENEKKTKTVSITSKAAYRRRPPYNLLLEKALNHFPHHQSLGRLSSSRIDFIGDDKQW